MPTPTTRIPDYGYRCCCTTPGVAGLRAGAGGSPGHRALGAGGVRHGGGVVAELPLPHVDLVDGETDGDVGVEHLQFGDLTPKSDDLLPPVLSFLQGEPVLTDGIIKTRTYFDLLLSLQFDLS